MKSGYDNYTRIWGNPYYDDEAVTLKDMSFGQRLFTKWPALVSIQVKDGFRSQIKYNGQIFDPKRWRLDPKGWNHEHCHVCQFSIIEGMTYWSASDDRYILCDACHEHYRDK